MMKRWKSIKNGNQLLTLKTSEITLKSINSYQYSIINPIFKVRTFTTFTSSNNDHHQVSMLYEKLINGDRLSLAKAITLGNYPRIEQVEED